ncbi:MAG TPA: disulfide bond formation protein B [Burkholderiales bacterium]|nr:disulfide bond formation protein B [Burkholderiales bacterium]
MRTDDRLPLRLRLGYALGFAACTGLIGFAYYLEYFEGQIPCPLCILQRGAFIALGAVFLAAALHGPARLGAALYGALAMLVAAAGAAIAARQVWLQHLPPHRVPECGPGLEYLLRKFPLSQALGKILAGTGECAEVGWTFLGLSIAGWSLVWFVLLGALAIGLAVVALRSRH